MGQRHQIYVIVKNPLKNDKIYGEIWNENDKKEAKLYFGSKNYSVLPFHNQWLYGATAVSLMASIMNEALRAKGVNHPFSPDFNNNMPYRTDLHNHKSGYGYVEMVGKIVNYQSNIELAEIAGRFGYEKGFYVGDEYFDYTKNSGIKRCHKDVQFDFTNGDNNDGVTIIDTINQKYCFINIFNEQDVGREDVHELPPMQPVSWLDYLKAYYPDNKEIHEGFKKHLKHLENRVLTKDELMKYFPNSYLNHIVKQNS